MSLIGDWLAGMSMSFIGIMVWIVGSPVLTQLNNIAISLNFNNPLAYYLLNFVVAVYKPISIIFVILGIVFIVIAPLRVERDEVYV